MMEPPYGILFGRCCVCGVELAGVMVERHDDANGATSHGYCDPCNHSEWLKLEIALSNERECEECLERDQT